MKRFLMAAVLLAVSLGAQPRRVGVFTFSRDSIAGLGDERLDMFRREIGKYADALIEIAYSRESAQITVQFLGQGSLAIELDAAGDAVRHLWTPDEKATRMWAVVRIGAFSKEFSVDGSGGRDVSRLARHIGEWLQGNSSVIRETRLTGPPGG